jgi:hypothetical protein
MSENPGTVKTAARGGTMSHEKRPPMIQKDSQDHCRTFLYGM